MTKSAKHLPSIPDFIWLALIALAVFAVSGVGLLSSSQNDITELRASYSKRAATGDIVFLGIDKQSLDYIGVWPWPRSVHADIIDRLMEMDVAEIGIDIDFSSASNEESDLILAQSLEKAGGAVILPVFMQDRSADKSDNNLDVNRPIAEFEKHAWLASVNVITDADGIVRSFPSGSRIDGEYISSMPSVLSGEFDSASKNIAINFAIDPATIPSYSVSDLLNGKIKPEELRDKTVFLGAQAVELHDNFAVPLYGSLSGAIVQILTAETLKQGVWLSEINSTFPLIAIVLFVAFAFMIMKYLFKWRSAYPKFAFLALASISFEVLGLYLYQTYSLVLPTTEIHLFVILTAIFTAVLEMDLQHWLLVFANVKSRNTQDVLNQIVKDNANGILVVDEEGLILNINERALSYFGLPSDVAIGSKVTHLLPRVVEQEIRSTILQLKTDNIAQPSQGEVEVDNNLHENRQSTLEYSITASQLADVKGSKQVGKIIACVTAWDITVRLEQERLISYHANYDGLTGLLRRNAFHALIIDRLETTSSSECCTIFALNLHRFKTINVTLGRDTGDEVLIAASERIKLMFSGVSDVARLGGDIFALVISGVLTQREIQMLSDHMITVMSEPFHIGKSSFTLGLRVSAASSTMLQDASAAQLIENAEVALDEACKTSGNGFVMYEEIFTAVQDHARAIESDLWKALDKNEFEVYYQPQVDINDCYLTGVEALIRWKHPELGFVSPADFVEIAEANGFIDKLGQWVLVKACEDALLLPDHITVAVNVSPIQFKRTNVVQIVQDALRKTGLPANRLHIEITEAGFLESTDEIIKTLNKLREMGVCLALDDFGTGFSSLSYFATFPINKIKVDQMFVRTLERNSQNEAIIRSVKELATGLDLKMICEGVETQEQLDILREIDVHEGQGYFFGKPQPIHEILEFIAHEEGSKRLSKAV